MNHAPLAAAFGIGLAVLLVGLGWLDHVASGSIPGVWLMVPLAVFVGVGTRELLRMMASGGIRPVAWAVYAGNILLAASPWGPTAHCPLPTADWVLLAFAAAVILVFVGEMRRYKGPGGVTANLAGGVFAIAYIGVLLSFAVRLRLGWGIGALASLVIVAKMGDTGAYFIGRAIGRHKMSPVLSPKKTIEGAVGALVFSLAASWATFRWLVPATMIEPAGEAGLGPHWIVYGVAVCVAAIVGDLAESLIKRDTGVKDSGTNIPGLGGVLDLLDSVLLAAPVAYACWAFTA